MIYFFMYNLILDFNPIVVIINWKYIWTISLSLSLNIYIYVCVWVCVSIIHLVNITQINYMVYKLMSNNATHRTFNQLNANHEKNHNFYLLHGRCITLISLLLLKYLKQ